MQLFADNMATSPIRLLIINPNTSQHMTDGLRPAVEGLGYQDVSSDPNTHRNPFPLFPDNMKSLNHILKHIPPYHRLNSPTSPPRAQGFPQ